MALRLQILGLEFVRQLHEIDLKDEPAAKLGRYRCEALLQLMEKILKESDISSEYHAGIKAAMAKVQAEIQSNNDNMPHFPSFFDDSLGCELVMSLLATNGAFFQGDEQLSKAMLSAQIAEPDKKPEFRMKIAQRSIELANKGIAHLKAEIAKEEKVKK